MHRLANLGAVLALVFAFAVLTPNANADGGDGGGGGGGDSGDRTVGGENSGSREWRVAKEAIAAYNKALSIKPDYAPALEYRGVAHVMAGNKAAALADLQKLKSLGSPLAEDLGARIAAMPAN